MLLWGCRHNKSWRCKHPPFFMGLPDLWMGTQNYISTHIFSVNRVSTKMAELSWVLGIQKPAFGGFPNPTPSLELRNVVIRVHHLRWMSQRVVFWREERALCRIAICQLSNNFILAFKEETKSRQGRTMTSLQGEGGKMTWILELDFWLKRVWSEKIALLPLCIIIQLQKQFKGLSYLFLEPESFMLLQRSFTKADFNS